MTLGRIFLFILAFSLLEVMVLAYVADLIGWPVTIVLTVGTALLGSYLFRSQGMETWLRLNQRMQQGEMPGQEMAEGVMLLIGGAVLITPGFITDAIGFALLLPQSRRYMARAVIKRGMLQSMASRQGSSAFFYQQQRQQQGGRDNPFQTPPGNHSTQAPGKDASKKGITIDGEAKRTDDDKQD